MSRDVDIEFLGCFDTVSSCGAIFPRVLPFSTHNGKTRVFRHALALDEHRAKFRQETWHYSLPQKTFSLIDQLYGVIRFPLSVVQRQVWDRLGVPFVQRSENQKEEEEFRRIMESYALEDDVQCSRPVDVQEVRPLRAASNSAHLTRLYPQVWFAGDHCGTSSYMFLNSLVSEDLFRRRRRARVGLRRLFTLLHPPSMDDQGSHESQRSHPL